MPNGMTLNPMILVKLVVWIATVVVAAMLLRRRKVTSNVRLAFLVGGVLVFGFVFGLVLPSKLNPNPVASLRQLLTGLLVRGQFTIPVAAMLVLKRRDVNEYARIYHELLESWPDLESAAETPKGKRRRAAGGSR